ncbi:hypothetical protein [Tenacibaculum sp. UWU-22]|uniref:hypothetical protein n=1 Tax=Tenacibaculum sp. UWU-22 TaxID=3234187 RepID=UPI0034DB556D
MKKHIYKTLLLLFFLPLVCFATNSKKKHEKSKTIAKEFAVNSDATVSLINKYGNINVTTWNKNQVAIIIKITVKGDDLDRVEQKLASIDVSFNNTLNAVSAETTFKKIKSNWFSSWIKSNNENLSSQINYSVKMPATSMADFNNKYGNIYLDKLENQATINCQYGNLNIDNLLNEKNTIYLAYGKGRINNIKSGKLTLNYSDFLISKAEKIKVDSNYSNLNFKQVNTIDFNADYGNVTVDDGVYINGNSDYAKISLGSIEKTAILRADYGSVQIKNLVNKFEKVAINGSYTAIKIGVNHLNNFNFTVDLSYAGFNYPKQNVSLFKSIVKPSKKLYQGVWGSKNSNSIITIKSDYGGVSIRNENNH